jgi:hypothetical protein
MLMDGNSQNVQPAPAHSDAGQTKVGLARQHRLSWD